MSRRYVLGVDGGGTTSRLAAERVEGGVLFQAHGGTTNPRSAGSEAAHTALRSLFDAAWAVGLDRGDCVALHVGSAGVDRPGHKAELEALVRRASGLGCPIGVGNDAEPALLGALHAAEGILVLAGTGSIAYGRLADGASVRAGGWGHILGDEGSAYWIAVEGIRCGLRAREGREPDTGILGEALEFFGLATPDELVPLVYDGFSKDRLAAFAPRVAALRDQGDGTAGSILARAAAELCSLAVSVRQRLGERIQWPRIAFTGGVLRNDATVRADLDHRVRAAIADAVPVEPLGDAVSGACMLARVLAGGRLSP